MRDTAQVIKIENKFISVIPLITDACINCAQSSCAKRGKPFTVINAKNLPIQVGTKVKISAQKTSLGLQAVFALGMPIFASICAYFFTDSASEQTRVLNALIAFFCVAVFVFIFSSRLKNKRFAHIIEICAQDH